MPGTCQVHVRLWGVAHLQQEDILGATRIVGKGIVGRDALLEEVEPLHQTRRVPAQKGVAVHISLKSGILVLCSMTHALLRQYFAPSAPSLEVVIQFLAESCSQNYIVN